MAHGARRHQAEAPNHAMHAGVLALLYLKSSQWHLVFIERSSSNENDRHKGQISFPGGKREVQDHSIIDTALRETEEEVGIDSQSIKVIGQLTDLYIPVSNFNVFPTLGYIDYEPTFSLQQSEVRSVLEIPLEQFFSSDNIKFKNIRVTQNITLNKVPYYDVKGNVIWGATAMIMSELISIIQK